jgi:hypothetical protein
VLHALDVELEGDNAALELVDAMFDDVTSVLELKEAVMLDDITGVLELEETRIDDVDAAEELDWALLQGEDDDKELDMNELEVLEDIIELKDQVLVKADDDIGLVEVTPELVVLMPLLFELHDRLELADVEVAALDETEEITLKLVVAEVDGSIVDEDDVNELNCVEGTAELARIVELELAI